MTTSHDFSEFLKDRDRILMAAWTLPNEGTLAEAQRKAAMQNFVEYCRRHKITYHDVAHQLGSPRYTLIRDLTKGVFRDGADTHIRTLNNWVEQHARQQKAKIEGTFVTTKVARDMQNIARMVRENQTMGLVFGSTGIGKTRCAKALHETYVGSIYLCVMYGKQFPSALLSALADKLDCRSAVSMVGRSSGGGKVFRNQIERVVARLESSNRFLIIDEAHQLPDSSLEVLRSLHDETGVPILLVATKELADRVHQMASPDAGQLHSRFDIIVPLTQGHELHLGDGNRALFTIEDIKKLYQQPPIKLSPDAANYLLDIANEFGHGSLRRCRVLLMNAARRARKRQSLDDGDEVTVTADDLDYTERKLRPSAYDIEVLENRKTRVRAAASA